MDDTDSSTGQVGEPLVDILGAPVDSHARLTEPRCSVLSGMRT